MTENCRMHFGGVWLPGIYFAIVFGEASYLANSHPTANLRLAPRMAKLMALISLVLIRRASQTTTKKLFKLISLNRTLMSQY